jgi:hypothetical protein
MKTNMRLFMLLALLVGFPLTFLNGSDKLHMKSGRVYAGRIVAESDAEVKILLANGITLGFGPQLIERIEREPVEAAPNTLPDAAAMLAAAQSIAPQDWVQIPATLIDDGILRNVPYQSYRSGALELNIYGDPAAPAGVEVGIYGASTALPFKKRLVAFVSEVTGAEFPESFNLDEDKKRLGLIDYEVTPPTAPDAYGGWWISAYDMSRLESSRIADNEINAITTQRSEIALKTKADEAKMKLEAVSAAFQKSEEWTSDDLVRAVRPTQTQPSYASSGYAGYSSGRVWVRSYVRKDGTFVRGHSRSR